MSGPLENTAGDIRNRGRVATTYSRLQTVPEDWDERDPAPTPDSMTTDRQIYQYDFLMGSRSPPW
jgi:hypothetical protein